MIKTYSETIFQPAGSCNGQGEMPLPDLIGLLIKTATGHANSAGFGYARLIQENCSWVLSRVTIDIDRLPVINCTFTIETWVENVNRLMTTRSFVMRDESGNEMLKATTTWCAINLETRRPVDLTSTFPELLEVATPERQNGVMTGAKPRPVKSPTDPVDHYRFRFSDIDLNRHVNSCRYIDLIVDHWDTSFFDRFRTARLDLVYHREAREGQHVDILAARDDTGSVAIELRGEEGAYCIANISFAGREKI